MQRRTTRLQPYVPRGRRYAKNCRSCGNMLRAAIHPSLRNLPSRVSDLCALNVPKPMGCGRIPLEEHRQVCPLADLAFLMPQAGTALRCFASVRAELGGMQEAMTANALKTE